MFLFPVFVPKLSFRYFRHKILAVKNVIFIEFYERLVITIQMGVYRIRRVAYIHRLHVEIDR